MTNLTLPMFTNEAAAIAHMEADRWPNGVTCPLCGVDNVLKMGGKTQAGMWMCNGCRGKFTVRTGTVFERSHIPLHKWLLATHLMASSKKGISAHQLHRMLGITYKSAWFMAHRIRAAMDPFHAAEPTPTLGGEGKVAEIDESFIGTKDGKKQPKGGPSGKRTVMSPVERGGEVRSFHIERVDSRTMKHVVQANVKPETVHYTDGWHGYRNNNMELAGHDWVDHSKNEYVRGEVHTNTVEGYFSVFKRGMIGVYQHCGEQHLHRYLAEFDFRQSNRAKLGVTDDMRADRVLKGAQNKRLTYRQSTH